MKLILASLLVPVLGFCQVSFETYEGYSVGALTGNVLDLDVGSAEVTNWRMADGSQSVKLTPSLDVLDVSWAFDSLQGATVAYASFAIEALVSTTGASYEFAIDGAYMKLSELNGQLSLSVYDITQTGESGEPGYAHEVYTKDLTEDFNWCHFTVRFDYQAGIFDFYVDGQMVAADFTLAQGDTSLLLESDAAGELYLDRLAFLTQPLDFEDKDLDGLPDEWESAHGLSAYSNDRYSDLNADGENNLQELLNGTDPSESVQGGGTSTGSEVTIYLRGRQGYFTLTEQSDRSPLVPQS